MSGKKNKSKYTPKQKPAAAPVAAKPPVAEVKPIADPMVSKEAEIANLANEALDGATEQDLEAVTSAAPNSETTAASTDHERLEKAIMSAQEARELFRAREKRAQETENLANEKLADAERALADNKNREERVEQGRLELETRARGVVGDEARWKEEHAKLAKEKVSLIQREADVHRRELEAEAGFEAQMREALRTIEAESRVLREEMSRARQQMHTERAAWEKQHEEAEKAHLDKLREEQSRFDAALRAAEDAQRIRFEGAQKRLDAYEGDLRQKQVELDQARRTLEWDQIENATYKKELDWRVEKRLAGEKEKLEYARRSVEEQLAVARSDRDRLSSELEQLRENDRSHGHRSREDMGREIEALIRDRHDLQTQLATRLDAKATVRLQQLEDERERWESERYRIAQENVDLKREVTGYRIDVTDRDALQAHNEALASSNALLHAALEELRNDVDERVRRASAATVFPECSKMDADENAQQPSAYRTEKITSLAAFVEDICQRMASDPRPEKRRYYQPEDVRCFLGGLAASRLLLLQGISGTGKTSLPIAFARAIGAKVNVIAVQAGWRDKHDLIGHYNSFERKYHESELLRALYEAQTPQYKNTIFLVVLDEMNLSHPEHYFADFLSALEQQEPELQSVELAASLDPPLPKLLRDGRRIDLPKNVWFVGTANHDETTKDFADKTYDRAHVMELPRKPALFETKPKQAVPPLAFADLVAAFDNAKREHQKEAQRAYRFLTDHVGPILRDRFDLGWGNRLERQMDAFVPVVLAANGKIGEATDHVLATKLLRKIKGRHETLEDDLVALRQFLEMHWKDIDDKTAPTQSMTIVQNELRRFGKGKGDG